MKASRLLVLGSLGLVLLLTAGPITVGDTRIINDYPEAVTFEVDASSDSPIVSVRINLLTRGDTTTLVEPAQFTPGRQITARYVWKTRQAQIPPGAPVQYKWTIRDEAGNEIVTEPQDYIITDARFEWQTLQDEAVALWWYEGNARFGKSVFDTARQALDAMEKQTGQSLAYRLHIVLYANDEDFDSWHRYAREWVGGEAYAQMGLTVQIVPPRNTGLWIQSVIPHEIAHLFFYQITHNPLSSAPPTWLNEGFAQYHEFTSPAAGLLLARRAAQNGTLIPLRLASGSFTGSDERIALLYAESLSAVTFLVERWGDAGLARLLAAYRAGLKTDDALVQATGLNLEEFQEAWWEWLGGAPGLYPTPPAGAGLATPRPPELRPTVPPPPVTVMPVRSAWNIERPFWILGLGGLCVCCAGLVGLSAALIIIARALKR